jgi:hypothetical protein
MEFKQDVNVAGTVILDGEYPKCESSMSFIAENVYLMFEVCFFCGGFYAAQNDSFLPKFRDNHSSRIGCRETSVTNYHSTLNKLPSERRSHLYRSVSLKPRTFNLFLRSELTCSSFYEFLRV